MYANILWSDAVQACPIRTRQAASEQIGWPARLPRLSATRVRSGTTPRAWTYRSNGQEGVSSASQNLVGVRALKR